MECIDEKFIEVKNFINQLNEFKKINLFDAYLLGYIVGKYNYKINSCIDLIMIFHEYRNNKENDEFILDLAQSHLFNGCPGEAALIIMPKDLNIQMPFIDDHRSKKIDLKEEKVMKNSKKATFNYEKNSLIDSLKL